MLYSEFLRGTGCRDNEHNYNLYKELEIIYMNTDCTKEHIYMYGKKLADNSKSEKQLQFEAETNEKIEAHKKEIEYRTADLEYYKGLLEYEKENGQDAESIKRYKNMIKYNRDEIKAQKQRIKELKWIIANCNLDSRED